jgi:hypothetical protein
VFPPENLVGWHQSPGYVAINTPAATGGVPASARPNGLEFDKFYVLGPGNVFTGTPADAYVKACLEASANQPDTVLMWDVSNEPSAVGTPTELEVLLLETLRTIKTYTTTTGTPARVTSFGGGVTNVHTITVRLATETVPGTSTLLLDVVGLHMYGHNRLPVLAMIYDAQHVNPFYSHATRQTTDPLLYRPILFNEIGFPGIGSAYKDAIRYCRWCQQLVPSGSGYTLSYGIGYMPWVLMIGNESADDHMPYKESCGLFFADPSPTPTPLVRDQSEVQAFVDHALAEGIPSATLWPLTNLPAVSTTFPQKPLPNYFDEYEEWHQALEQVPSLVSGLPSVQSANWDVGTVTLRHYLDLFTGISTFLAIDRQAATNTDNMITQALAGPSGAAHEYIVQPAELATLGYFGSACHPLGSPSEFEVTKFFLQLHYGQELGTFQSSATAPSFDMRVIREIASTWRDILHRKMGLNGGVPRRGKPPLFQGN